MKIIGLTGGIGSGKTTVANFFKEFDVPLYIADVEAKLLMNRSKVIKRKLCALFGDRAYKKGELNKPYIASKIFNDDALLQQMNAIVHPKVATHFRRWLKKQKAPYVIYESAIIFENGSYDQYDIIITVTASIEERLKRVIKRDDSSKEKVLAIMANQWEDSERVKRSDFIIVNDNLAETKKQVLKIHQKLSALAQ